MHVAVLTQQIGHYHDARYRAAAAALDRVTVISTANERRFAEFAARDLGDYSVERLFGGREDYRTAVRKGAVGPALRATLDRVRPDAVAVAGWASAESFAAIAWARSHRVPSVMMSESQDDDAVRSTFRELLKARLVRACDAGLVGGPPHRDYLAKLGLDRSRIELGYNAVDNDHFKRGADAARAKASRLRAEHGLPERYVLSSARFVAKKNLARLVEAFALARRETGEAVDLVILGGGEERPAIEAAIDHSGLADHVHLPGFRSYEVLPDCYGLAEGFAHVSTVEQWGLVVNEAMAAGLPVVVSAACGVARSVVDDGQSGFIVDPGETASIARGLARLLALAPGDRAAMGRRASEAISDWGPQRFGAGLRAAVESARAAPPRGALAPSDRLITHLLERRSIQAVQ